MNAEKLYFIAKELLGEFKKIDVAKYIEVIVSNLEKLNKEIDANSGGIDSKFNKEAAIYNTYKVLIEILNNIERISNNYRLNYLAEKIKEVHVFKEGLDSFFSFDREFSFDRGDKSISNFIGLNLKNNISAIIDNFFSNISLFTQYN